MMTDTTACVASPPGDHYGRERRQREAERERSYVSRADPSESTVSLLDYGDSGGRTSAGRRRRESDESASRRDRDAKVCLFPLFPSLRISLTRRYYSVFDTPPVRTARAKPPQSLNQQRRKKKTEPYGLAARKARLKRINRLIMVSLHMYTN